MGKTRLIALLSCIFASALCGCEHSWRSRLPAADDAGGRIRGYGPARIKITPLTEFVRADADKPLKLKVYVELLDAFGSRIKGPGMFRFELYEYVPRATEPKGKRISIWPDIDLTGPQSNNDHWRDFLRAYQFILDVDFEIDRRRSYMLQATCLTAGGQRLSADFKIGEN